MRSLTNVSMRSRASGAIWEKCVKSKRSRSGRHHGAGLFDMVSQFVAQGRMQDMGGGMVQGHGTTVFAVYGQHDRLPVFQPPAFTRPLWMMMPVGSLIVSVTAISMSGAVMVPRSPTWPPASP
jgi:hypothetical protein